MCSVCCLSFKLKFKLQQTHLNNNLITILDKKSDLSQDHMNTLKNTQENKFKNFNFSSKDFLKTSRKLLKIGYVAQIINQTTFVKHQTPKMN